MDRTLDYQVENENNDVLIATQPSKNSFITHIPLVYTTRLEDMRILKTDMEDMSYKDVIDKILYESKPKFKKKIHHILLQDKSQKVYYNEMCKKLDKIKRKCFDYSDQLSVAELDDQSDIIILKHNTLSNSKTLENRILLQLCRPCSVVLEDCVKYKYVSKKKHIISQDAILISSDDDDDDDDYDDNDNQPLQQIRLNIAQGDKSPFTNVFLIMEDAFSHLFHGYRINEDAKLTEYFSFSNKINYNNFVYDSETSMIRKRNCCWYAREYNILLWLPHRLTESVSRFMRIPHPCTLSRCLCCCRRVRHQNLLNKKIMMSTRINTEAVDKEIEDLDKEIQQAIQEWNIKNKDKISNTSPKTFQNLTNVISVYDKTHSIHNDLIEKILQYDYLPQTKMKNTPSLNTRDYSIFESKCVISLTKQYSQNEIEYYVLSLDGKISVINNTDQSKYMGRLFQSLYSNFKKGTVCCWFRREEFISKLKLLPSVKFFLRKPHLCVYNHCTCCCKRELRNDKQIMLYDKQIVLCDMDLPQCAEHMKLNKMTQRNMKLRNNVTAKKQSDLLVAQNDTTNNSRVKSKSTTETYYRRSKTQSGILEPSNIIPDAQHPVPRIPNIIQKRYNPVTKIAGVEPNTQTHSSQNHVPTVVPNAKPTKNSQSLSSSSSLKNARLTVASTVPNHDIQNKQNAQFNAKTNPNNHLPAMNIDNNESMLQSILAESLKCIGTTQTKELDSLISSILERFRDVRLVVTAEGKVAAALNTPINTLSNVELKVLANILYYAQSQVDSMGLFKKSDTTTTNVTSTRCFNVVPTITKVQSAALVNVMSSKNEKYIQSYKSYESADTFQTPVIQNVFSLNNAVKECSMNPSSDQVNSNNNSKQPILSVHTSDNSENVTQNKPSVQQLPCRLSNYTFSSNVDSNLRTQFIPAAVAKQQPVVVINSGAIEMPSTSLLLSNVAAPTNELALTDNEIKSILLPNHQFHKAMPSTESSIKSIQGIPQKSSILHSILANNITSWDNPSIDPTGMSRKRDAGTDPLEPAYKKKRTISAHSERQKDTVGMPIIASVSSMQTVSTQPSINESSIEYVKCSDPNTSDFHISQNHDSVVSETSSSVASVKDEISTSDEEDLSHVETEGDSMFITESVTEHTELITEDTESITEDAKIKRHCVVMDEVPLSNNGVNISSPLVSQNLDVDDECILGI